MPPEIPQDLSSLTDEELSALEAALIEFANTAASGSLTPDTVAALKLTAEGTERIRSELSGRQTHAEELASQAQAALARIRPPDAGTDGQPPADGAPGGGTGSAPDSGSGAPGSGAGSDGQSAVTAGAVAVLERVVTRMDALDQRDAAAREAMTAAAGELVIPPLSTLSRRPPAADTPERPAPILASATPRAAENIEGIAHGAELQGASGLLDAMLRRAETLPIPRDGQEPIRALFAAANIEGQVPEDRMLRTGYDADNWRKIAAAMSPAAVLASGGGCSLFQPYYDIMQISSAERPVRDSFTGFGAQRAGITILAPPTLANVQSAARTVTDGATNSNTSITSATAAFTQYDVGATITGTGIPAGALISSVQSATAATLTAAATATATGVTFVITRQGSVTFITQAIDASALGAVPGSAAALAGRKNCLHVNCPTPTNTPLAAISRCIELGNFQARAYPEQEPVWLELMMAAWAQVGETKLLDVLAANSTAATSAALATLGAARLFPSLVIRAARAFRQAYRVNERLPLHVWAPAWLLDLMVVDLITGSGFEAEFYSMARQQVADALAEANVNVTWYIDSGTGKGQYMGGSNSRVTQSAGAALAFPATAFWYLSHEGAYGFLDGGELDFGLVRDSTLNSRNDFQVFSETFEAGFFRGIASWEFASAVAASGSAAPVSAAITGW